jgi:flagellin-specific chaperone FliS
MLFSSQFKRFLHLSVMKDFKSLSYTKIKLEREALSEIKKAIVVFHYAEKIKSNLILTFSLLDVLDGMRDEEISGAEKLLVAYFNALIREVNIAANASEVQGFQDVSAKLDEAVEQTRQHNYANAMKLVSEAISITTTNGNKAAETLKEKDLI